MATVKRFPILMSFLTEQLNHKKLCVLIIIRYMQMFSSGIVFSPE